MGFTLTNKYSFFVWLAAVLTLVLFIKEPALVYGDWTPSTSEENAPVVCRPGEVVDGFRCQGRYCDNIALHCVKPFRSSQRLSSQRIKWSKQFSEEGNNREYCSAGFLTGIACSGRYCDNISFECSEVGAVSNEGDVTTDTTNCDWLNVTLSEEQGKMFFDEGEYATGIECDGSNCDNKRFRVCEIE